MSRHFAFVPRLRQEREKIKFLPFPPPLKVAAFGPPDLCRSPALRSPIRRSDLLSPALCLLDLLSAVVMAQSCIPFDEKDLASEESLWSLYEKWCIHNAVARDLDDKHRRFNAFKENTKFIHEFNQKGASYKLGLNKFADMTNQEFRSTYTGGHRSHHHMMQRGSPKDYSEGVFTGDCSTELDHGVGLVGYRDTEGPATGQSTGS